MWSMPRSVLRVVAVIIGLCAVAGFVLGVRGAPEKARLPGEGPAGAASGVQLQATDAKPLDDAALAAPPPVVVVTKAEEVKKPAEKKPAADPRDLAADQPPPEAAATVTPTKPPAKPATPATAADDRVGDLLDGITPADDPPH